MTYPQRAIALLGLGLIAAAVVGCVVRRRYRSWYFFSTYLDAVLLCEALPQAAPRVFFTPEFWLVKETGYAVLRFAMACEVGIRTMRAFPGALATARRIVLFVLAVTLVAVATAPSGPGLYITFIGQLQPRVLNGSVWMMLAIGGVILYYRLPAHPFHKAILLSYTLYLAVFTIVLQALGERRWGDATAIQYLNQLAYVALVAYWNYAIWRRDPPSTLGARHTSRPEPPAAGARGAA